MSLQGFNRSPRLGLLQEQNQVRNPAVHQQMFQRNIVPRTLTSALRQWVITAELVPRPCKTADEPGRHL